MARFAIVATFRGDLETSRLGVAELLHELQRLSRKPRQCRIGAGTQGSSPDLAGTLRVWDAFRKARF